ncbi:site-2 protease family protein [Streptomyces spiralis]
MTTFREDRAEHRPEARQPVPETLPLARIAGVRVGLHWSVLVIVSLVAVALAHDILPHAHPGRPAVAYWASGLLGSVLFIASLAAHELAHAVVARRHGVQVDDITLWMLGGAARLHNEPHTPGAELRIAGAGPLTSLLIGGTLAGLIRGLQALDASGLMLDTVAWLAAMNIVLAVFNALPAAPLDGGRLLHAFLWRRTGDRLRATRGASAAGRALGWLMVIGGGATVLFAGNLSGLWPAVLGWFIVAAATVEARQAELNTALRGIPVSRMMSRDVVTVPTTATIDQFLSNGPFGPYRHSAFPVLGSDGAPVGLITVGLVDLAPLKSHSTTTIGELMRPLAQVTTAAPGEPACDLVARLNRSGQRRALVLDEGHLVGIVTLSDVDRALTWLTTATRVGLRPGA